MVEWLPLPVRIRYYQRQSAEDYMRYRTRRRKFPAVAMLHHAQAQRDAAEARRLLFLGGQVHVDGLERELQQRQQELDAMTMTGAREAV